MHDTAKELAQSILDTAQAREDSYDKVAAAEAEKKLGNKVDFNQFYKLSLRQAAAQECCAALVEPVYLMLSHAWNDALDWARDHN